MWIISVIIVSSFPGWEGGGDSSAPPSPQCGSKAHSYFHTKREPDLGICMRRLGVGVVLLHQANVGLFDLFHVRVLPHLQQLKSLSAT